MHVILFVPDLVVTENIVIFGTHLYLLQCRKLSWLLGYGINCHSKVPYSRWMVIQMFIQQKRIGCKDILLLGFSSLQSVLGT